MLFEYKLPRYVRTRGVVDSDSLVDSESGVLVTRQAQVSRDPRNKTHLSLILGVIS